MLQTAYKDEKGMKNLTVLLGLVGVQYGPLPRRRGLVPEDGGERSSGKRLAEQQ